MARQLNNPARGVCCSRPNVDCDAGTEQIDGAHHAPTHLRLRSDHLTVMYRRLADLATLYPRVPLVRVDVLLDAVVISVVPLGSASVSPALSIRRAFCLSVRLGALCRLRIAAVAVVVDVTLVSFALL